MAPKHIMNKETEIDNKGIHRYGLSEKEKKEGGKAEKNKLDWTFRWEKLQKLI